MSIAGIRSNRGDHYQILIALDWAISVLADDKYRYLEIDSTARYGGDGPVGVDDIVIACADGTLIACQCKKNQQDCKDWSVADLGPELTKAARFLADNPGSRVRFYSRSNFGDLAKLREHAQTQPDETAYRHSLGKGHQNTDRALAGFIQTIQISTFAWLQRTAFEISREFDREQDYLKERLSGIVANPGIAYQVLSAELTELAARGSGDSASALPSHKLEKSDLESILSASGVMRTPPISEQILRQKFADVSKVGRCWRREVADRRLSVDTVEKLIDAIDASARSILLSGIPGSGKTCILLALQEKLEARADIAAMFIQTREYVECLTPEARAAQGLPDNLPGMVARMAEHRPVVLILDSLDVLSLSREHHALKFFLSLIDRCSSIPQVTLVAACRDFDRKYDRNLSVRPWGRVVHTQPLNWDETVAPFLRHLGLDPDVLPQITRSLLQNPRELAMFADIVSRVDVCNVATSSQALSQQYLQTVVRDEPGLGTAAMVALESMADKMLKSRRLDVPQLQTGLSDDMFRALCSANILHENGSSNVEFGHQTLLDVLVMSSAQRRGLTLKQFIAQLTPVPFVRPAIRAFIVHLAAVDRASLRRQLRAVFTSNIAFHIRRLAAESLAEQMPQDDDWSLIRDLYQCHRDVFQPLYMQAASLEWHRFWLQFFVPYLLAQRDGQGLFMHMQRIGLWKKTDTAGVMRFWLQCLTPLLPEQLNTQALLADLQRIGVYQKVDSDSNDWTVVVRLNRDQIVRELAFNLHDFDFSTSVSEASHLLQALLTFPYSEYNFLGKVLAHCVDAGKAGDDLLWQYVAGDITQDDVFKWHFDNKLHCAVSEFGDQDFLSRRMAQSECLLDLAIETVEQWAGMVNQEYDDWKWNEHFLLYTSYARTHNRYEYQHVTAENMLFAAIENAVLQHAARYSDWWQAHCHVLCDSAEAALRYIAILALTQSPEHNPAEIGRLLTDTGMLTSRLSYEMGNLLYASFVYLDSSMQDAVGSAILNLGCDQDITEDTSIRRVRGQLLQAIPVHLRSPQAETQVRDREKNFGIFNRTPEIYSSGGFIKAPFSYEILLGLTDVQILRVLRHYRRDSRSDLEVYSLIGGTEEVKWQLREAASRSPVRFIHFLADYWSDIPQCFIDGILDGIATYLAYLFGGFQFDPKHWQPVETPDPPQLASLILDEIERHPACWRHNRAAAKALEACANVVEDDHDAARLLFAAIGFLSAPETVSNGDRDLINKGINTKRGNVAEAVMILATRWTEKQRPFPPLLKPTLRRYASDEHPAIRALILRRLPYLQYHDPDFGWALLALATADNDERLWKIAEPCLYHTYFRQFDKVAPVLQRIVATADGEALETWGRISALASFTGLIDFDALLAQLQSLKRSDAWRGAATVWTGHENLRCHPVICATGIQLGLQQQEDISVSVAMEMSAIFRKGGPTVRIPFALIDRFFSIIEQNSGSQRIHIYDFSAWLNALAQTAPQEALMVAERFADYVRTAHYPLYDSDDVTQLLTHLFREAEECEEAEGGAFLNRVVALQDAFLSTGYNAIQQWLRDAERP